MKKIKPFALVAAAILCTTSTLLAKNSKLKSVSYDLCFHCQKCVAKVESNVPYFKGVKELKIDKESGKVTIEYDGDKTDSEKIKKSLVKLKVEFKEEK